MSSPLIFDCLQSSGTKLLKSHRVTMKYCMYAYANTQSLLKVLSRHAFELEQLLSSRQKQWRNVCSNKSIASKINNTTLLIYLQLPCYSPHCDKTKIVRDSMQCYNFYIFETSIFFVHQHKLTAYAFASKLKRTEL